MHGCSNYASAELQVTWAEAPISGGTSCKIQCLQNRGCVGFAWLTDSDTTCKGPSQSKGSCTLWKEACIPDYYRPCTKWSQYKLPVATRGAPDSSSSTMHGCSNHASATLKFGVPSDQPSFSINGKIYGKGSCGWQCAQTSGCVGFAWLTDSDTTCKGPSQSKGSCTLWKETCIPDYSLSCKKWTQYKMWIVKGEVQSR
jgi:hypothetical protein